MRDLSDETQVRKAAQWAKLDDKARQRALSELLNSAHGRSYVYDLLDFCGVFRSGFSSDALRMAFNCGTQSVGLWIMADMESTNPSAYQQMILERNDRNATRSDVLDTVTGAAEFAGYPGERVPDPDRDVIYPEPDPSGTIPGGYGSR